MLSVMKGLIFNVKKYSLHDGPGIRVTFFMKGCPLSCWWCHNPEGISPDVETVVQVRKIGEREFRHAENAGQFYTVDEIMEIAGRERIFLEQSGGGVTFSGGEPMSQPRFLTAALKELSQNGYHTAIDTSGYGSVQNFKSVIPYTDLFLFDIKHLDNDKHLKFTGVSNRRILANLRYLLDSGKDVFIRLPIIPDINDDIENLSKIKDFIAAINRGNIRRLDLLPFHRIGTAKYRKFNMPYRMAGKSQPGPDRMNEIKEFFSVPDLKVRIGG
jgi:pyruvate formate lyase activating enzyme